MLVLFAFAKNDLHGEIPSDIGLRLPNLIVFHTCFNKFSGPMPPSLHNVTKIKSIRMSNNQFTSSMPLGLNRLHNLVMYNIGFNHISDTTAIIKDLTNCTNLQFIALDENLIEGWLPDSFGNLSSSLEKLYLGGNRIKRSNTAVHRKFNIFNVAQHELQPTIWEYPIRDRSSQPADSAWACWEQTFRATPSRDWAPYSTHMTRD